MRLKHLLAFTIVVAISFGSTSAFAHHGRTIYYNGKVFTSNTQHLWAEGVVVEGQFIVAVGSTKHVLNFKENDSHLVNLNGNTMIPGFNDAHVHPYDNTSFPRAVHLNLASDFIPNPGPTLQDVVNLVQQGAANNPPGTWLFVSIGTNIVENPNANRVVLDAVSPNHPVLLASWYGHGTYLNTKAMQTIGIGEQEPDPFGGFYERFPNSNVITGVVHEYAEHLIRRYFANQMTDQEFKTMYESFAAAAAQMGYTSVQEFSVGVPQQRHLDLLAQSNIPIRWRAICFPLTLNESCDIPAQFSPNRPFTKVKASGIKWIADGTHIERGGFLTEDYADAPGVRGHLNFPPDSVESELRRSATGPAIERQPMFHALGDGTSDTILERMGAVASDTEWRVRRPRIEHGTLLRPDRFESARKKGVFVVQNPLHFSLAPFSNVRFSSDLLADIDSMTSLLAADIKLALGSDSVATPGNPYLDLFFALIQPTRPLEALTIEQAVIAYTKTSAEAEFQEQWKGTLEPGKLADLVVLSQDIFALATQAPQAIVATQSILTVVDGKVVYDAGRL
jgi:predicted amidohydrolase YtcJ